MAAIIAFAAIFISCNHLQGGLLMELPKMQ